MELFTCFCHLSALSPFMPRLILPHWQFYLSFWLWLILLLFLSSCHKTFMPLMNCSFSLKSFSLYLHSFPLIQRQPIHSSGPSFFCCMSLQYWSNRIVSLFFSLNFPLTLQTSPCWFCTHLVHCHSDSGLTVVLFSLSLQWHMDLCIFLGIKMFLPLFWSFVVLGICKTYWATYYGHRLW